MGKKMKDCVPFSEIQQKMSFSGISEALSDIDIKTPKVEDIVGLMR